jgi:hypothetical protein
MSGARAAAKGEVAKGRALVALALPEVFLGRHTLNLGGVQ